MGHKFSNAAFMFFFPQFFIVFLYNINDILNMVIEVRQSSLLPVC